MLQNYVPILILFLLAAGFGLGMVLMSAMLGPRRPDSEKLSTYECGMTVDPGARRPFDVKYYLVAMVFLVFDVEVVFLYPWAVKFKALGLFGFVEMLVFLFILLVGYAYIWRKGVLEWE
ncbi:NADH-quinone oxidoreductase subunit A [Deferrisoma camini]|uniref:NADH-quinone oxidoreductase subunit A n=1 Tax=Deferrisoma camini TaxID=1035120 RepID=UPI00046CE913|nr:NADH-quinone oxidoreductase subunit A [Deferrisoma camini]NOY45746.1 NAD(P)H-quinone oxidoreductase subunit 3 [Deltaproteobacteria bacterium]